MNSIFLDRSIHDAVPVLIEEGDMRRASEKYINFQMNIDQTDNENCSGRYLDKDGMVDLAGEGRIYVLKKRAHVIVEKSCEYHPEYM